MAKYVDYKKMEQQLLQRTEGYASNVRAIYEQYFTEIINLVKGTELEDGVPFSFSEYGYGEEVNSILRKMYSRVYQVIRGGVEKEWLTANENNDELVKAVFGESSIEDNHFARFFMRNKEAMDAFFARKNSDHGLNLSQKVWNYTGQFKEELENTLDLAIGEGTGANRIATKVKQYLNEPDKWYRRFRYKKGEDADGNPVYGLKWKRRVWDKDSESYKWVDDEPKDYHPGRGVYRSSARNAQRLARTETNMAYRTADFERWQQLDFVVGIEIKLSNNHTTKDSKGNIVRLYDVCDDLAGIYPKTFKWRGWHPHCRCYQVPVLAKDDEMNEMLDAILDGKNPAAVPCEGKVREIPAQFTEWMERNEKRVEDARERGTLPYFIRDNERVLNPPTAKEIAKRRHEARTQEQVDDIQKRWNEARIRHLAEAISNGYLPNGVKGRLDELSTINNPEHFEEVNSRIAFYQSRAKAHMERDPKEVEDIRTRWEEKQNRDRITRTMAENVLKLRSEYPNDVDYSSLEEVIANNNLTKMREEAKRVAQMIKNIRDEENALSDIIPDAHEWHKTFTIDELKVVKDSILDKLDLFKAKGWGDFDSKSNIGQLKHSLEWQAEYMKNKGSLKYKTWEVAQKAYLKLVDKAQDLIDWDNIETDLNTLKAFKTSSKEFNNLLTQAIAYYSAGDKSKAQLYIYNAVVKKDQLTALKAKRAATKAAKAASASSGDAVMFGEECFTEARRMAAKVFKNAMEAEYSELFDDASKLYRSASDGFKEAAEEYTHNSGYLTKWLRGCDGFLESSYYYAQMAERHTREMFNVIRQATLKQDMWLYRDERAAFLLLKAGGFDPNILQSQIEEYTRKITDRYIANGWTSAKRMKELQDKIDWFTDWRARQLVGRRGIDPSIISCGSHEQHRFSGTGGDNKKGYPKVRLEIYCPKGTQALYAAPYNYYNVKDKAGKFWDGKSHTISISEAEVFLQRDTEFRIISARWDAKEDRWFVKVEVLGHHARDFEMESTPYGYKAKFK